jgi:membrane protease subunit HflC
MTKENKKGNKFILIAALVVVAVILLLNSIFVVQEGEFRVVFRFGEAIRIHNEPGLQLKIPFIETESSLPKYQMIYDSAATPILTLDQKPIIVDNYTVWRINDVQQFLRALQTINSAEQRLDAAVYNAVRRRLSATEYGDIISAETARGNLNDEIEREVSQAMESGNTGIEIIDVRIKRTDLPEENKESVYNRMISDRRSIAASYLSQGDEEARRVTSAADRTADIIISEADAQAKEIMAEGEQEAARIYNEAYGKDPEFYKLYRTLESYKISFNGEPVIMLPIDSPYAQLLMGLDKQSQQSSQSPATPDQDETEE